VKRKSIPVGNYRTMMHTAEPAPSDRGSCHPDRCGYEHRPERRLRIPDRARLSTRFGREREEREQKGHRRWGGAPSLYS